MREEENEQPSCLFRTRGALQSWFMSHPCLLVLKVLFWVINIIAGGAHLQGTVNGLGLLFPALHNNTALLHDIALPLQVADASAHIAVSVLGSNEMIDGLGRLFASSQSFWSVDATLCQRLLLSFLALFLVFTAEVSETYRNWQNNAGDSTFMRIFWVAFFLSSNIPEVLYSTMLMVRDYFSGFKLNGCQAKLLHTLTVAKIYEHNRFLRTSELGDELVTFARESHRTIARHAIINSNNDIINNNGNDDDDTSDLWSIDRDAPGNPVQRPSKEERRRQSADRTVRWLSRGVGLLLAIPTYVVKSVSGVEGFYVLFNDKYDALSWTLGISGMLAEAYLEYTFAQIIVEEVVGIVVYRLRGYDRPLTGHVFYSMMPSLYWTLFGFACVTGLFTLPATYYSGYSVLSKKLVTDGLVQLLSWLFAVHYVLLATTGTKLLLENIITCIRSHWQPAYGDFIRSLKKQKAWHLREWQLAALADPDRLVCCFPLSSCPANLRRLCFVIEPTAEEDRPFLIDE